MIDCFQMESDVDNPINVVHVCDIINHELIVAAQNSMLNGCCYDIKKQSKLIIAERTNKVRMILAAPRFAPFSMAIKIRAFSLSVYVII